MATRGGGDNSAWPMTLRTAAHPQHELVHLLFNRNSCKLCGGALAGKLGYRCNACNFDVHCTCLPDPPSTLARGGGVHVQPTPHAHHHPPPPLLPRPRPYHHHQQQYGYGYGYASAYPAPPPPRSQFHLTLSDQFNMQHQHGAQTSSPVSPAPTQYNYPAPQYSNSYGRAADSSVPVSYNHLQQQGYYQQQPTNNYGDYMNNYNDARNIEDVDEARDFGDADDYYNDIDD